MNSRERVLKVLDHREADRVPVIMCGNHAGISKLAYDKLCRYLGTIDTSPRLVDRVQQIVEPDEHLLRKLGVDFRFIYAKAPKNSRPIEYSDDSFRDEWGIRSRRPPGGYWYDMVNHPLREANLEDLENYQWPDPTDAGRFEGLEKEAKKLYEETDYALATSLAGSIYEQSWYLRSYPKFTFDLYRNPTFAEKLMDKILEFHMAFFDRFLDSVGQYIQIVFVGDDLAEQRGPAIRPSIYRSLIKPRHRKLYQFIKSKADVKLCYHSCGSVVPFINDLIEMGVDILTPVQVSAADMDTKRLKNDFGDRISFLGGVDTQRVMPFGTVDDVRDEVKRRVEDLAPAGGYILGAVHNIQPEVPPENILAMFDAARKYGSYPLSK
ncbi:MAG: uroporphyrinogen decarboxylase family protein [Candidatus Bathyarchaeia archaeon]|jgi:uroporphyrinogen decarboxylase